MGAWLDSLRHLDKPRHPALHGFDPLPLRHQRGPVSGCHTAIVVLQKTKVQETGADHDLLRLDCRDGYHLPAYVWMVSLLKRDLRKCW